MIHIFRSRYYFLFIFFACGLSVLHASILSTSVESIRPNLPKVGERMVLLIALVEDPSLRALKHTYSYTDSSIVEFIRVQRRIIQKKQYIEVVIRIKKSGTIDLPAIYENNYRISLPLITVISSIKNESTYSPISVGFPLGIVLYAIVGLFVYGIALVLLLHFLLHAWFILKKWKLVLRNVLSHIISMRETKKMLNILNKIGTLRMRTTCTTKELYCQLDIILRKRLQFLLGYSHANSMTYAEITDLLSQEFKEEKEDFMMQLYGFFFIIYDAEYGTHSYPLEVQKRHCVFLLTLLKKLKWFPYKRKRSHLDMTATVSLDIFL